MIENSPSRSVSRRTLLRAATAGALWVPAATALGACSSSGPGLVRARPTITHGVASGEVAADGAVIWTRTDRPATMIVETSATENFANARREVGPLLTPDTDGTGRFRVVGLESGQLVHYRVTLEGEDGASGEPVTGVFTTAPTDARDIRFVWSGDVAGQGWGINPDLGGMPVFGVVADREPHFFLHSGDAIYADGPIVETRTQTDGAIYRNVTAEAKNQVAQTLDQFRGNYAYNLTDEHYRRFAATVPQVIQWDDHEIVNNWFPGEDLTGQNRAGYTETDVDTLAGYGRRAWQEWQPVRLGDTDRVYRKVPYGPLLDVFVLDMRSHKNPNPASWATEDDGGVLGAEQTRWLIDELNRSTATWKVVANDLPISIVVADKNTDPAGGPASMEAVAQGDPGAPRGREIAFARILSQTKDVTGLVFLTADVHYTAAISYDPARAAFRDFTPFWEFVSGPLHAGAFPQSPLDTTFGAAYEFVHAPTESNVSPAQGFQHFGEITVDGESRVLTVTLCDATGQVLYRKDLPPDVR